MDNDDFEFGMFGPQPMLPSLGFPDALPTHPEVPSERAEQDEFDYNVRVEQFDLNNEEAREALETVLTKIVYGTCRELRQKWSADKEGSTMVALSYIELIPKKRKVKRDSKVENPWATHGENPGIPDGEYPGQGAVLDPEEGETDTKPLPTEQEAQPDEKLD